MVPFSLLTFFNDFVCQMVNETKHGCSILVSSVPKRTAAKFSLQDPSEVFVVYMPMKSFDLSLRNRIKAGGLGHEPYAATLQVMEFLRRLVHWKQWGFGDRSSVPVGVPSIP